MTYYTRGTPAQLMEVGLTKAYVHIIVGAEDNGRIMLPTEIKPTQSSWDIFVVENALRCQQNGRIHSLPRMSIWLLT